MRSVIDLSKEYGLVLDGGGARGAYQIGAWKALREAGVKICAVAGTSVGALNGAFVCTDEVEKAERLWSEISYSKIMDIDDALMERIFKRESSWSEFFAELRHIISEGGVDITPLKELIQREIDEEKVRASGREFCLFTFSLTDFKEMDLSISDIPEGMLDDFLLASAYLIGFKNEKLHGKRYLDGGIVDNAPVNSLLKRGYKNLIEIHLHAPGIEPRVRLPEDAVLYEIEPRADLGNIIEFDSKRVARNIKLGYYDAKRFLYGLEGYVYYIEQNHDEKWYEERLSDLNELEKAEMSLVLRLPFSSTETELYTALLEGCAKQLKINKFRIYTVDELLDEVTQKYIEVQDHVELPKFVHVLMDTVEKAGRVTRVSLKGRNFLTLLDYTPEEITYLLGFAHILKTKKKNGVPTQYFKGKNIALIFEKTSTRTRCAFEVASHDLGMSVTYLDSSGSQIGKKESIKDTARVLGRMFDGIEYRGFGQEKVEQIAKYAGVPVWNGLTNEFHPTQVLADLMTIKENFGTLKGIKLTYMGDARYNMGNSLMIVCSKMGMDFVACTAKKYFPDESLVDKCRVFAQKSGGSITLTEDVGFGTKDADVIYTDVWVSMGEPDEVWEERIRELTPYKVTAKVMANAKKSAIFLHCLPSFHDLETKIGKEMGERFGITEMEVTDEVFESGQSKVFDEAENRMHTIKAVMAATLGEF